MTKTDIQIILITLFLALVLFSFTKFSGKDKGCELIVEHNNEVIEKLQLPVKKTLEIADIGKMKYKIEILGNKVRVAETDCPRQLCKNMGFIKNPGESLICIPNRIHIYIKSSSKEEDVDAYTW